MYAHTMVTLAMRRHVLHASTRVWGTALTLSRASVATATFATRIDALRQQLQTATAERKGELLRHGRQLFELEVLDDLATACTPTAAANICAAATQLRIAANRGHVYDAVVQACMRDDATVDATDMSSFARIAHSCLVLHSPQLYDLLFTYLRHVIAAAPSLDAVTLAVLINAYGRAEVHHAELYTALCTAAATRLSDPRLSLAHVANVLHALARVRVAHRPLLLVLRDHALRACNANADVAAAAAAEATATTLSSSSASSSLLSPIMAVTVLNAFAELDAVDAELFDAYEQQLLARVHELQPPLLTALLSCLATARRATPHVMDVLSERVVALAEDYDAAAIARTCDAYYRAGVLNEDVLGALAERACKVAGDFRSDEVRLMLHALSALDLFDAELYPLLASRLSLMLRQGSLVRVDDAAAVLASFAAVRERNDELAHVCTALFAAHLPTALGPCAYVDALWACVTLNIRNEAQTRLVEHARAQPSVLTLPSSVAQSGTAGGGTTPRLCAKTLELLQQRRAAAMQAYSIPQPPPTTTTTTAAAAAATMA